MLAWISPGTELQESVSTPQRGRRTDLKSLLTAAEEVQRQRVLWLAPALELSNLQMFRSSTN